MSVNFVRSKGVAFLRSPHPYSVGIILLLAVAWFLPLFSGSSFSAVPGYKNAVYPWAAHNDGRAFYPQSDQAALTLPLEGELAASVRSGTLPLWNPDSFGGQPLFADGSSALAYPPRLALAATASPTMSHNVLSLLHVALAGVFTYWLLVDLEMSPLAALFGAVAWMFGSFTLAWLQLEVVAPVFAWLPAGLVTSRKAVHSSWRWTVAAGVSIAMLFLSTHLLFADIALLVIVAYAACLGLQEAVRRWTGCRDWRILVPAIRAAVGVVLGAGLAAVVLVPTAAALRDISRQQLTFAELSSENLLPLSSLKYVFWHAPLPITEPEMEWGLAFVGTATAVFALIGLFLRRKGSGLGRGLVIVSLLVAVGGPVSWLAFELVPGMNVFRPYSRLLFVVDFGLAVLGAVGMNAFLGVMTDRNLRGSTTPNGSTPPRHSRSCGRSSGWWLSRGLAVVVIGVTAFQLGSYGRSVNPPFLPASTDLSLSRTPLIDALVSDSRDASGWPNRVLPANDRSTAWQPPMLDSNTSLVFGIDSAGGYDSSVPTRTVDMWRVVAGEDLASVLGAKLQSAFQPTFRAETLRYDLLPRLGVDRIALTPMAAATPSVIAELELHGWKRTYHGTDGSLFAYTAGSTGPYVAFNSIAVPDDRTAITTFLQPDFHYGRAVVREGAARTRTSGPGKSTVIAATRWVNGASITVEASKPGTLVVPDTWDAGWMATVNGSPVPVQRANFNQQAVAVPPGRSVVLLHYRPVGFNEGLVVTAVALIVCLSILLWPKGRRPRQRSERRAECV